MEDFSLPYRPLNISPDEDDSNSNYASLDNACRHPQGGLQSSPLLRDLIICPCAC